MQNNMNTNEEQVKEINLALRQSFLPTKPKFVGVSKASVSIHHWEVAYRGFNLKVSFDEAHNGLLITAHNHPSVKDFIFYNASWSNAIFFKELLTNIKSKIDIAKNR